MKNLLGLLAQNSRFESASNAFKWSMTIAGIGILIAGLGFVFFSKPKEGEPDTSPAVKAVGAVIIGAIGLGVMGYAWLMM